MNKIEKERDAGLEETKHEWDKKKFYLERLSVILIAAFGFGATYLFVERGGWEHQTELSNRDQEHERALEISKQQHQTELSNGKQTHERELDKLAQKHESELEKSKQQHESVLKQRQEDHDKTVRELESQLRSMELATNQITILRATAVERFLTVSRKYTSIARDYLVSNEKGKKEDYQDSYEDWRAEGYKLVAWFEFQSDQQRESQSDRGIKCLREEAHDLNKTLHKGESTDAENDLKRLTDLNLEMAQKAIQIMAGSESAAGNTKQTAQGNEPRDEEATRRR